MPKSNDALYIDVKGQWYFIEFKNGSINSGEIYKKLFDSIVMLLDEKIIPDIQFVRDNINYILVYNSNKYGKIANSPARESIYRYTFERAEEEEKLFDIDKFEQYLFRETHTYTPSLFKKEFVLPKEREEGIEMNVIHSAWKNGCKKLEFLGSSCIYPRMAPQPMKESCLLTSELEKTNEAYALAKISGLKYCEFLNKQYGTDYISVMPTNLYGPNDNYHPTHSHVLPALIRRFHEAKVNGLKEVTCWGDGSPLREFLYVDDLANLCVFLMNNYSGDETVNAGTGKELTIKELTELVAKVIGYEGEIKWDSSKPNGTPRKLLDVSKATNLGWTYKTELEEGIRLSYEDFLNNPMRAER